MREEKHQVTQEAGQNLVRLLQEENMEVVDTHEVGAARGHIRPDLVVGRDLRIILSQNNDAQALGTNRYRVGAWEFSD